MLDVTRHPWLRDLLGAWDRVWVRLGCCGPLRSLPDPNPAFYERIWGEAARALGATLQTLGCDAFEISRGRAHTRVHSTATPLDDMATHCIVRYKAAAYGLLAEHGLPTPRHASFRLSELRPALAFLDRSSGPCVIKPGDGAGGGRGITTGIRSHWQLLRAAHAAAAHGADLLIEEQVEGDSYRLLYLDGELLDAVLRRPPAVVGNGRSTIAQLIRAANRTRLSAGPGMAHTALTLDLEVRWALAQQGYSLRSIPAAGRVVRLKSVTNESSSQETLPVASLLCPALVEEGARAAAALGVRLAGVDILTCSPSVSLHEARGVVLEVSTCPGLFWHYHRQGPPTPVCIPILRRLLKEAAEGPSTQPGRPLSAVLPLPSGRG